MPDTFPHNMTTKQAVAKLHECVDQFKSETRDKLGELDKSSELLKQSIEYLSATVESHHRDERESRKEDRAESKSSRKDVYKTLGEIKELIAANKAVDEERDRKNQTKTPSKTSGRTKWDAVAEIVIKRPITTLLVVALLILLTGTNIDHISGIVS